MPPATTTAVPLQGDRLSRPARRPGCQTNAGPQRLGDGTPRSSGSCAPQSRARPFFACFHRQQQLARALRASRPRQWSV